MMVYDTASYIHTHIRTCTNSHIYIYTLINTYIHIHTHSGINNANEVINVDGTVDFTPGTPEVDIRYMRLNGEVG